jgi:hypothetical protein
LGRDGHQATAAEERAQDACFVLGGVTGGIGRRPLRRGGDSGPPEGLAEQHVGPVLVAQDELGLLEAGQGLDDAPDPETRRRPRLLDRRRPEHEGGDDPTTVVVGQEAGDGRRVRHRAVRHAYARYRCGRGRYRGRREDGGHARAAQHHGRAAMRFVLCDDDELLRSLVETVLERQGHEVIGVADHTAIGSQLVKAGKPDAVIVDLSLGYNTDFDIIETAIDVGARVIIFSHNADHLVLGRYSPTTDRGEQAGPARARARDRQGVRRRGGARRLDRRAPSPAVACRHRTAADWCERRPGVLRGVGQRHRGRRPALGRGLPERRGGRQARARDDRVLDTGTKLLLFLAGGGTEAIVAFLGRMHEEATGGTVRSIVVNAGESGGDAFSRLKSTN